MRNFFRFFSNSSFWSFRSNRFHQTQFLHTKNRENFVKKSQKRNHTKNRENFAKKSQKDIAKRSPFDDTLHSLTMSKTRKKSIFAKNYHSNFAIFFELARDPQKGRRRRPKRGQSPLKSERSELSAAGLA